MSNHHRLAATALAATLALTGCAGPAAQTAAPSSSAASWTSEQAEAAPEQDYVTACVDENDVRVEDGLCDESHPQHHSGMGWAFLPFVAGMLMPRIGGHVDHSYRTPPRYATNVYRGPRDGGRLSSRPTAVNTAPAVRSVPKQDPSWYPSSQERKSQGAVSKGPSSAPRETAKQDRGTSSTDRDTSWKKTPSGGSKKKRFRRR